jgi:hypothetical protein
LARRPWRIEQEKTTKRDDREIRQIKRHDIEPKFARDASIAMWRTLAQGR